MRILVISNMYPSKEDGLFGVFVKNFVESISDSEHDIEISVIRGQGKNALEKLLKYLVFYLRSAIKILFTRSEINYYHFASHCAPLIIFNSLVRSNRIVVNVHGSDVLGGNFPFKSRLLKLAFARAKGIVVPSSYFEDVIVKHYGHQEKIHVYPSGGINTQVFKPSEKGDLGETLTLSFASRLTLEKGWELFLLALAELQKQGVKYKALVAGKGPDEGFLRLRISELSLSHVEFLGFINQEELCSLFQQSDVFVFPSYRMEESLGLVGVEAMACGTPVIGSNMAGISTYVVDCKNGYLFEPQNTDDLVDCILKYGKLKHEERRQMSQEAIKTAEMFESRKVKKDLLKWLSSISL